MSSHEHHSHSHGDPSGFAMSHSSIQQMRSMMQQHGQSPGTMQMPSQDQLKNVVTMMQKFMPTGTSMPSPEQMQATFQALQGQQGAGDSTSTTITSSTSTTSQHARLVEDVRTQQLRNSFFDFLQSYPVSELVKLLDKDPSLIQQRGFGGMSPLHKVAHSRPDPECVRLLLRHGADVMARNDYNETPLHFACRTGHIGVVHAMIEAGADPLAVDDSGRSAMHAAAQGGGVLVLLYLNSECGLDTHATDNRLITPLHLIASYGHEQALEFMLKNNRCKLHARDEHGNTALHIAAQYARPSCMWRLMETMGRKGLVEKNNDGFTPEDLADQGVGPLFTDIVKILKIYKDHAAKSGKITGPNAAWYALLLGPTVVFVAFILLSLVFESRGITVVLAVVGLTAWTRTQSHRINHISRMPNPTLAGLFFGGMCSTLVCYFFCIAPVLFYVYNPVWVYLTAVIAVLMLYLHQKIIRSDPGRVTISAINEKTGKRFTLTDIAKGTTRVEALCANCELIPPIRAHHCRLCNMCVHDMDHHCLWLYTCIARNTHRFFVIYIINVMTAMLGYGYMVYLYVTYQYSSVETGWDKFTAAFNKEPAVIILALLNVASVIWLIILLRFQFGLITKGFTTAFQPYRGPSTNTFRQKLQNLINFFKGRPVHAVDGCKSGKT